MPSLRWPPSYRRSGSAEAARISEREGAACQVPLVDFISILTPVSFVGQDRFTQWSLGRCDLSSSFMIETSGSAQRRQAASTFLEWRELVIELSPIYRCGVPQPAPSFVRVGTRWAAITLVTDVRPATHGM